MLAARPTVGSKGSVARGGWLAGPAGVLTGAVLAVWPGRLAVIRLADRQVSILLAVR